MLIKLIRGAAVGGEHYAPGAVLSSPQDLSEEEAQDLITKKKAEPCGIDPRVKDREIRRAKAHREAEQARKKRSSKGGKPARTVGGYAPEDLDPGPIWVVIPTHDRPAELRMTLRTVFDQEVLPEGVLVVDDGTENPVEVRKVVREFKGVKLLRLNSCSGAPNLPRIEGMKKLPDHAMVVELDDHDLLCPGAMKAMRKALRGGASFVYGHTVRFAVSDKIHPDFTPQDWFAVEDHPQIGKGLAWQIFDKPEYEPHSIRDDGCYVCGVRAYRRELYDYVGGWREHEVPAGDAALFLRMEMALNGEGIIALPRRLTWTRMAQDGISQTRSSEQQRNTYQYKLRARTGHLLNDECALDTDPADHGGQFTKRFGLWIATSGNYSGGRLHMYQGALTLVEMGAEVFIVTNGSPRWAGDYPPCDRIRILIEGKDDIPSDIDVVVTDSKTPIGKAAKKWAANHSRPLACVNFETPNWVEKFVPEYAVALGKQEQEVFKAADVLIANSRESARHLQEWLGTEQRAYVLPPKVNTYALELSRSCKVTPPARPYAVWSSRSAQYKGGDVALKAVWALKTPFDLVAFGQPSEVPPDTRLHKLHIYHNRPDVEKYALMRKAHVVLAPSKFEGYGMVPMEALCSGTPCIVYDLPVLREEYLDNLEYVPWGDEDAFCKELADIASKAKMRIDPAPFISWFGLQTMRGQIEDIPHFAVQRPVVSAHMIAYWGFVPESLESVYDYVDEIRIAFGRVRLAPEVDDGSLKRLQDFPDPDSKITLEVRDEWANKKSMRAWGTKKLQGNYHLLLDGDEIWTGLDRWVGAGLLIGSPRWVNFWHGPKHWVHDAPGEGLHWGYVLPGGASLCPHYRWSYWRESFAWMRHCVPASADGHPILAVTPEAAETVPKCVIYHLGHALSPEILEAKHRFYFERDREPNARAEAWSKWDGKTGPCGDGTISKVDWKLPDIVKRAMKRIG